jgi:hypothetical protein
MPYYRAARIAGTDDVEVETELVSRLVEKRRVMHDVRGGTGLGLVRWPGVVIGVIS